MREDWEGRLGAACAEWADVLDGDDGRLLADDAILDDYGRTTLSSAPRPAAVLRPIRREQVTDIVRVAARHGVPLYPISRGLNWGWGDRAPVGDRQVVLDLAGLDRIVEVDDELGIAVVEPGVTQAQLAEHLAARAPGWMVDSTTAGPNTSILGNTVERGIGQTAQADRWASVTGVEAVLADGSVVRTGFGHFPGAAPGFVGRWGVGPVLDGLFTQSNLGIVVELGLTLMPAPERVESVFAVVADRELESLIDVQRALRLRGLLSGAPHIFPLLHAEPRRWLMVCSVAGTAGLVQAAAPVLDRSFGDIGAVARFEGIPSDPVAVLDRLTLPDQPIFREFLVAGASYAAGQPYQLSPQFVLNYVGGAAGQRRTEPPDTVDPIAAGYGFHFLWPAAPAVGREVRRMVDVVADGLARHGRPLSITLSCASPRLVVAVSRVAFDRADADDCEAADRCYREVVMDALRAGFPPARASITSMDLLDPHGSPYWSAVRRLKDALDPDGILAPGRYLPPPPA